MPLSDRDYMKEAPRWHAGEGFERHERPPSTMPGRVMSGWRWWLRFVLGIIAIAATGTTFSLARAGQYPMWVPFIVAAISLLIVYAL